MLNNMIIVPDMAWQCSQNFSP